MAKHDDVGENEMIGLVFDDILGGIETAPSGYQRRNEMNPEMAMQYYRYCQTSQYFNFKPISWKIYRELYFTGLNLIRRIK